MIGNIWPAVADDDAVSLRSCTAEGAPVLTVRLAVAESELAASDAVRVCGPDVISVAEKLPWPLLRVESGGSTTPAALSLLLKCSVPA